MLSAQDRLPSKAVESAIRASEQDGRFVREVQQSMREMAMLVPAGETFIIVDEDRWASSEVMASRKRIPFLERQGQYWGKPPDDETAIGELERLRQSGASFIAFACPAFWWLDYYSGFHRYLRSQFRCVLQNERVLVFDLRR